MTLPQECKKLKPVTMKCLLPKILNKKILMEPYNEEPAPTKGKSTTPVEKTAVPREWRHNASYPNKFILENPDDKI